MVPQEQRESIVRELGQWLEFISSAKANAQILDPSLPVDAIEMLELFEDVYIGYDPDRELPENETLGMRLPNDLLRRLATFYTLLKGLFVPRRSSDYDATMLASEEWHEMQRQAAALARDLAVVHVD